MHFVFLPEAREVLIQSYHSQTIIPKIASGSLLPLTLFQNCHVLSAFKLLSATYAYQHELVGKIARKKITNFILRTYNNRPRRIFFKVPHYEVLSKNQIITLIKIWLESQNVTPQMRTLILHQTSIVFKGHKKLSVILNNHIKWCKKWCRKIPFPCFCSEISDILNVPLNSEGHISCF